MHHSALCTYNALFTDQWEQYNTSYLSNNTNWQHYFDLCFYWCSRCSWLLYIPAIRAPIFWLPASKNDCIKYEMLGGLVSYLRYLWVFAYSGVRHIVFCVFVLFVFVVSTLCCQLLWIVLFWLRLRYTLTFIFVLCLVYPVLPVSLDCPFLIASSVFANVYFRSVASFSGLSFFYCPFGIL